MEISVRIQLEESRHYWHYRIPRHLSHETQLVQAPVNGIDTPAPGVLRFSREVWPQQLTLTACQILTGLSVHADTDPYEAVTDMSGSERGSRLLAATDADLEAINRDHALKELKADDIRIYERYVVNDAPTRGMLWFTKRALEKLAVDYGQGRSRLLHHDKNRIIGRTFAASVVNKKIRGIKANWTKVKEYLPINPQNMEHIQNRDNGLYAFDSIGFGGGKIDLIEQKAGEKTRYFLQIDYDPEQLPALEAGEVSDVFLGNVFGAGNDKQQSAVDVSSGSRVDVSPDSPQPKTEEQTWLFLTSF